MEKSEKSARSIFRGNAVKHYMQNRERDVLPRLISPFVFGFYWILLALLLIGVGLAWWSEVPMFVMGSGLLLPTTTHTHKPDLPELQALLFVPVLSSQPVPQVSLNTPVLLNMANAQLNGQIVRVDPGIVSPDTARKRYKLSGGAALLITLPSLVLHARLTTPLPVSLYGGSVVQASVQSGSQRILSLVLPSLTGLMGGAQ